MRGARVRVAFQVELSVSSLFDAPTIARLAVTILQQKAAGVTFLEHWASE